MGLNTLCILSYTKRRFRLRVSTAKIVEKPWGREIWYAHEREYAGKILEIKKGFRSSLQYHEKKKETMYVLEGEIRIIKKDGELTLKEGESVTINPGEMHRIVPLRDSKILESSTPELDDVIRVEDDYNR
ncbi:MAG: cupin [Candidatus Altiarchaeales archaeon]|nr:MAG: cupin [Candidatus Altiarchaeales archaeon]